MHGRVRHFTFWLTSLKDIDNVQNLVTQKNIMINWITDGLSVKTWLAFTYSEEEKKAGFHENGGKPLGSLEAGSFLTCVLKLF
jgi:hypothetical protein